MRQSRRSKLGLGNTDKSKLGVYSSADITLEEGVALEKFAAALGTINVDHFPRLNTALSSVNRPTLDEVARADAVIVIGADLYEESGTTYLRIEEMLKGLVSDLKYNHGTALADLRLKERMDRKRNKLAVFAPIRVKQMEHAGISDVYAVRWRTRASEITAWRANQTRILRPPLPSRAQQNSWRARRTLLSCSVRSPSPATRQVY